MLGIEFQLTIPAFIALHGEAAFLQKQKEAILGLTPKDSIISPGGSVIYSTASMEHLRRISTVIFLDTPLETILARIASEPRSMIGGAAEDARSLLLKRQPLYVKYADKIFRTEGKNITKIVDEIVNGCEVIQ